MNLYFTCYLTNKHAFKGINKIYKIISIGQSHGKLGFWEGQCSILGEDLMAS